MASQSQIEWAGRIKAAVVPALRRIAPALADAVEADTDAAALIDSPWRYLADGRLEKLAGRWEEYRAGRAILEFSLWRVPSEFGAVAICAVHDDPSLGRRVGILGDSREVEEVSAMPGDRRGEAEAEVARLASNPRRAKNLSGWIAAI